MGPLNPESSSELYLYSEYDAYTEEIKVVESFAAILAQERAKDIYTSYSVKVPGKDATVTLSNHCLGYMPEDNTYTVELTKAESESPLLSLKFDHDSRLRGHNLGAIASLEEVEIVTRDLLEEPELGVDTRAVVRYAQDQIIRRNYGETIDLTGRFFDESGFLECYVTDALELVLLGNSSRVTQDRRYEHVLDNNDTLQVHTKRIVEDSEKSYLQKWIVTNQVIYEDRKNKLKYSLNRTHGGFTGMNMNLTDSFYTFNPEYNGNSDFTDIGNWPIRRHVWKLTGALIEAYFNEHLSSNLPTNPLKE